MAQTVNTLHGRALVFRRLAPAAPGRPTPPRHRGWKSVSMQLLDLSDDILGLVGEEVSAARARRLVVSLPFDIRDLRRLRCASYGGQMEVLYAPSTGLPGSLCAHIRAITGALRSLDPMLCLGGGERCASRAYHGIDLRPWKAAYGCHEANVYSIKASIGLKGSVRMAGHRPLMVRGCRGAIARTPPRVRRAATCGLVTCATKGQAAGRDARERPPVPPRARRWRAARVAARGGVQYSATDL